MNPPPSPFRSSFRRPLARLGLWAPLLPAAAAALLLPASAAPASPPTAGPPPGADVRGSRDHPLLRRVEGSTTLLYREQAEGAYALPLGPAVAPRKASLNQADFRIDQRQELRGRRTSILYRGPAGRSAQEVFDALAGELKAAGFAPLFSAGGDDLGYFDSFARHAFDPSWRVGRTQPFATNNKNQRYLAAKQARPERDTYAALYVTEDNTWMAPLGTVRGQALAQVEIVETRPPPAPPPPVAVGAAPAADPAGARLLAAEMDRQLTAGGRVAIYGVYFDSDQAEVKPESKPTLDEIAGLLRNRPRLRLLVVGHTDNQGSLDHNMSLSQRRAEAVVRALVAGYGVAPARLKPVGAAFIAPLATNRSDPGRAQNRRVELVEE